jgi:hypothetical protein
MCVVAVAPTGEVIEEVGPDFGSAFLVLSQEELGYGG